jgi:ankyrin repeat protein
MTIERKPYFVSLEPITLSGIKAKQQLFCIYTGKKGSEPGFKVAAEKTGGCALGTIFKKPEFKKPEFKKSEKKEPEKDWLGKVGDPRGLLRNDPLSSKSLSKKEINLGAIQEKLAYDFYEELGKGLFLVPKTRLSKQLVMDKFNSTHGLAIAWVSQGIKDCLRIMCRFIPRYQDLKKAETLDGQEKVSFAEYLKRHKRPPEKILTPQGKLVPLKGIMSLLAVSRCLADTDGLGGDARNAGFVFSYQGEEIQEAHVAKIDPGEAFNFTGTEGWSKNWIINTKERLGYSEFHVKDLRDLQTSNNNLETLIRWSALTPAQQEEFLAALFNASRYLGSQEVLHLLFYREGKFNRSQTEMISEEIARSMQAEMTKWMKWQLEIYAGDLSDFKQAHPQQLIRVHYIDKWGELSLPMAEEALPIRELFTDIQIVKEEESVAESSGEMGGPSLPSFSGKSSVKFEELFRPIQGKKPQKILLTGLSGGGKSTICQKIAHDWASGRLWNEQFHMLYWLPLRELNQKKLPMGQPAQFLAQAIVELILHKEVELGVVLDNVKQHYSKTLVVLDGYDEASPELRQAIALLFQEQELTILVTSRPGATTHLNPHLDLEVESLGFRNDQIEMYARQFFARQEVKKDHRPFLQTIRTNSLLFDLARTPLHLQMLCSLWEKRGEGVISKLTELYAQMIDELLLWNVKKFAIGDKGKILGILGNIAWETPDLHGFVSSETVEKSLQGTEYTKQDLLATGLLKEAGDGYCFLHSSFQAYFLALALTRADLEAQKAFVCLRHIIDPQYEPVFAFCCGMVFSLNVPSPTGESAMLLFFETLDNERQELTNLLPRLPYEESRFEEERLLQTFQQAFRCLDECPADFKQDPRFDTYLSKAFHCIKAFKLEVILFYDAVEQANVGMIQWLDSRDPELFKNLNQEEMRFAHLAAERGYLKVLQWLYAKDTSFVNRVDKEGYSVLHTATSGGHKHIVEWLYLKNPSLIQQSTKDGWLPFHLAASQGHVEVAEWLYAKNPSCINRYVDENTCLDLAAGNGHVAMVEWIYAKNPTLINKYAKNGWTALHSAAASGKKDMVEWLYAKKPTLIDTESAMLLNAVALGGNIEIAEWLYAKNPPLFEKCDKQQRSPLIAAIYKGHLQMVKYLYSKNPSLIHTYVPSQEVTPLHKAIFRNNIEIVQWICSVEPKQVFIKHREQNAFQIALWSKNQAIAEWLYANYPEACQDSAITKQNSCTLL